MDLLRSPGDRRSRRTVVGRSSDGVGDGVGCHSIRLQGNYLAQKVGIGDLDGDGRLDFVIKQPEGNIDPYEEYWTRSPETYKLEAYRHDGRFLWRFDLGWSIERGIWYSPYLVYDLDGDGKAEVAVKTGEGDPRVGWPGSDRGGVPDHPGRHDRPADHAGALAVA